MKTFQKFKRPISNNNGINNANNSKNKYNSNNKNNKNNIIHKKELQKKKKHAKYNSIYNNNYENNFNIEVNIKKNNVRVQSKKLVNNTNNKNQNLNSLNINFNNYTNNYNYNYNINSVNNINNNFNNINNGNINYNNINYNNSIINKGKSNSQKVIMVKTSNKNENNFKGIPINGFDKLITKKYNTRNYNIPMSVTDRIKQINIYSSSSIATNNTYSNRYKNSNNRQIYNNKVNSRKK